MKNFFEKINFEDVSQIIIGAAVMAIPIAFSEELWHFGETLPFKNIIFLFVLSLIIQSFYTYFSIFQGRQGEGWRILVRIIVNYILTFLTVAVILLALDKLPLSYDWSITLYRVIILSFPASLGGVIVDGLDKE